MKINKNWKTQLTDEAMDLVARWMDLHDLTDDDIWQVSLSTVFSEFHPDTIKHIVDVRFKNEHLNYRFSWNET